MEGILDFNDYWSRCKKPFLKDNSEVKHWILCLTCPLFFLSSVVVSFWQFAKVQSLLGHEDWIRDVAFAVEGLLIHTTVDVMNYYYIDPDGDLIKL